MGLEIVFGHQKNKNFEIVDMEAYALAKVCQDHGVEFRCFKFISDGGDPDEWKENVSKGSVLFANKLKQIGGGDEMKPLLFTPPI